MPNIQGKKIYLALPYSHSDPYIREVRYRIATSVVASLMKRGAIVFSPITYGHQFCQYGIDFGFEAWADLDYSMISWTEEIWLLEIQGYETSLGVQAELSYTMKYGKTIVRISEDELINFHSDTSPYDAPMTKVASAMFPRIAEVHYEFIVKSKYKYGDTIFVIDDKKEFLKVGLNVTGKS